jgi:hypothetical protein
MLEIYLADDDCPRIFMNDSFHGQLLSASLPVAYRVAQNEVIENCKEAWRAYAGTVQLSRSIYQVCKNVHKNASK